MRAPAPAKVNLALVVGPLRDDGKHELVTVYQRVGMSDRIDLTPAAQLRVDGFPGDTLVREALEALAVRAGVEPRWHATIEKRLPVAAGLGGGSSDAATALRLANDTLTEPLPKLDAYKRAPLALNATASGWLPTTTLATTTGGFWVKSITLTEPEP